MCTLLWLAPLAASDGLVVSSVPTTEIHLGSNYSARCEPFSWLDFTLVVTDALENTNLIFEIESLEPNYNPTALSVHLWDEGVPTERSSEHADYYGTGKLWGVGMNNECFTTGITTVGILCGAEPTSFRLYGIAVEAPLELDNATAGEVCVNEWVYHYFNVNASTEGKNLRFNVSKSVGAMTLVTQHLEAPLKVVPPYLSFIETEESATMALCNVEMGRMYLGLSGDDSSYGCAK
eukprot:4253076-Prymnesium_polylepis.1